MIPNNAASMTPNAPGSAVGSITGLGTGVAAALGNTAGGTGGFALVGTTPPTGTAGGDLAGTYPSPTLNTAISTAVAFSGLGNTTLLGSSSVNFLATSGTDRSVKLSNANSTFDAIGQLGLYPSGSGSNSSPALAIIPKGTGFGATVKAQFTVFNTDFIADPTNYEAIVVRAAGTSGFTLDALKAGAGTQRPIRFRLAGTDALVVNTDGTIGLGSSNNTFLSTPAAATLQQGVDSATPIAQKFQGANARAGTDSNVGGATITFQAGQGTGTGTESHQTFKTPIKVASGSGPQTMLTALDLFEGVPAIPSYAFASLPIIPAAGMLAYVTDSNTNTWGATIAGGGANPVLAWYNGAAWTVLGK